MKKTLTALTAALLAACTLTALPCSAESEWGDWLTRVPNDSFLPQYGMNALPLEWYYSGEMVENGVPQNKWLTVYEILSPSLKFSALHASEESVVQLITDCFPGAAAAGTESAKNAQFIYRVTSDGFRTAAYITDDTRDIAGTELLADALYDAAKDVLDLQDCTYYRKQGIMNYGMIYGWWRFSGWVNPSDDAEQLAQEFSEITAYLAENEPDWYAQSENGGSELGIYPRESIAADVTFADYTAVLAGITAATGCHMPMSMTDMGGESTPEGGAKTYMEPKQIAFGDVNADGDVELKDAMAALKEAADQRIGLESSLVYEQRVLADVDGDGQVTVKDAQYILVYYANTRAEIECSWQSVTGNPNAPAESNLA